MFHFKYAEVGLRATDGMVTHRQGGAGTRGRGEGQAGRGLPGMPRVG